jgi:hypothetical protein
MRTNSRKYLDQYEASKPRTVVCIKQIIFSFFFLAIIIESIIVFQHDTELDKNASLSVIIVVEDMTRPQDRRDLSPSINSQHENKLVLRTSPATEIKQNMEKRMMLQIYRLIFLRIKRNLFTEK